MSDMNWAALIVVLWLAVWLYASSRPAWIVAIWRQIERPIRWIERKMQRTQ